MKRLTIMVVVAAMIGGAAAWSAEKEEISVHALPPVVVKTVPESATPRSIRRSWRSRPRSARRLTIGENYSWAGPTESWMTGKPHWLPDGKTCVVPVKLQPGKAYATWLNTGNSSASRMPRAGRPCRISWFSRPRSRLAETCDKREAARCRFYMLGSPQRPKQLANMSASLSRISSASGPVATNSSSVP